MTCFLQKLRMKYTDQWEPFFKIPKRVNRIHLDYKTMGNSLYQRDFVEHPADAKGIVMKNDFYTTMQKRQAMDNQSTSRVYCSSLLISWFYTVL